MRIHAASGFRRWLRQTLFEFFGQITGLILRSSFDVRRRHVSVGKRNATSIGFGFEWRLRKLFFFFGRDGMQFAAGLMCVVSDLGRRR